MALPVIPIAVGALGAIILVVLTALALSAFAEKVEGKTLAILGPVGSGKTRLIKFMQEEKIPAPGSEPQTAGSTEVTSILLTIKNKSFKIKTFDTSGDKSFRKAQKDAYSEADDVLFMVRTHEIEDENHSHSKAALRAVKQIERWREEENRLKKVILVGTHTDKTPSTSDPLAFRKLPTVRGLIRHLGGDGQVSVVLGSLKTNNDARKLLEDITEAL